MIDRQAQRGLEAIAEDRAVGDGLGHGQ